MYGDLYIAADPVTGVDDGRGDTGNIKVIMKLKIVKNKLVFNKRIRYDGFKIRTKQSNIELYYTKNKVIT